MLGIPCVSIAIDDVLWLQRAVGRDPKQPVTVDVEKQEVRVGDRVIKGKIPDGARNQLVSGAWNAAGVLLEAGDAIEATAKRLPYVSGF
jgi:3-isopropylmalate/(R)-2-methylmalate dehydratase small subunit